MVNQLYFNKNFLKIVNFMLCHFSFSFRFLGLHPRHMEIPRPGVELEPQLLGLHLSHGHARSLTH